MSGNGEKRALQKEIERLKDLAQWEADEKRKMAQRKMAGDVPSYAHGRKPGVRKPKPKGQPDMRTLKHAVEDSVRQQGGGLALSGGVSLATYQTAASYGIVPPVEEVVAFLPEWVKWVIMLLLFGWWLILFAWKTWQKSQREIR